MHQRAIGFGSLLKRTLPLASALSAAALLLASQNASAATKPINQFSADQEITSKGRTISVKIHLDGRNARTEATMPGMPEPMVSIINGDRNVMWIMMPGNVYMEKPITEEESLTRGGLTDPDMLEHVGHESVNGVECDKYRIKGPKALFFYANEANGFPVRIAGTDGDFQINWKNVKPGPQPATLFQPPAGATKMTMPAGLNLPTGP